MYTILSRAERVYREARILVDNVDAAHWCYMYEHHRGHLHGLRAAATLYGDETTARAIDAMMDRLEDAENANRGCQVKETNHE